jgi:hypothetical protein
MSGAHASLPRRSLLVPGDSARPGSPVCGIAASFAPTVSRGDARLQTVSMFAQARKLCTGVCAASALRQQRERMAASEAVGNSPAISSSFNIAETATQQRSASVLALGWNRPGRVEGLAPETGGGSFSSENFPTPASRTNPPSSLPADSLPVLIRLSARFPPRGAVPAVKRGSEAKRRKKRRKITEIRLWQERFQQKIIGRNAN